LLRISKKVWVASRQFQKKIDRAAEDFEKKSLHERTIPESPATSSGFLEKFDNRAGLFF
jgi:5-methylcytosine-specific restriction endonuclease McrBC GTP-binding regulatory subunit McrB